MVWVGDFLGRNGGLHSRVLEMFTVCVGYAYFTF